MRLAPLLVAAIAVLTSIPTTDAAPRPVVADDRPAAREPAPTEATEGEPATMGGDAEAAKETMGGEGTAVGNGIPSDGPAPDGEPRPVAEPATSTPEETPAGDDPGPKVAVPSRPPPPGRPGGRPPHGEPMPPPGARMPPPPPGRPGGRPPHGGPMAPPLPEAAMPAAPPSTGEARPTAAGLPTLANLRQTRERPLFVPGRRGIEASEPAPVVAPPPAAEPAEEAAAPLALVLRGIVAGPGVEMAILADPADSSVKRMKTGEEHDGWRLERVDRRTATFRRGEDEEVLTLKAPGVAAGGGDRGPAAEAKPPSPDAEPAAE